MARDQSLLWLTLALIAAAAAGSWWLQQAPRVVPRFKAAAPSGTDYFARGAVLHTTNPAGQLVYRLRAQQVLHYPDGHITMTQPHLLYLATPTPWDVTADRAVMPSVSGQKIKLFGHVAMVGKLKDGSPFKLTAPRMVVLTQAQRAYTDSAVHMRSAARTADGVGMRANLGRREVELLHDVRVRYQP